MGRGGDRVHAATCPAHPIARTMCGDRRVPFVCSQLGIEGRARQKPRILPAATGAGLIAYSALNAGALGGPLAAGIVGAGVGCAYLGVPKTQLVDEGPLVLGGEFWVLY